jgi:hypothetical protein
VEEIIAQPLRTSHTFFLLEGGALVPTTAGGVYLASRTFKGLEPKLGETPVSLAVEGLSGIAKGYETELSLVSSSVSE